VESFAEGHKVGLCPERGWHRHDRELRTVGAPDDLLQTMTVSLLAQNLSNGSGCDRGSKFNYTFTEEHPPRG
jgi:hypothetical protein